MSRIATLALGLLAACATIPPAVPPVTSFATLAAQETRRTYAWTNPDGARDSIEIRERRIPIPPRVDERARDYLRAAFPAREVSAPLAVDPRMIVLHSMALGNLRDSLEQSGFLDGELNWPGMQGPRAIRWPVGSHFIIDQDGTIYGLALPQDAQGRVAFGAESHWPLKHHVVSADPWAIGIENIVPAVPGAMAMPDAEKAAIFGRLSEAQFRANSRLVAFLLHAYPRVHRVFGHHQFNDPVFARALARDGELVPSPPDPAMRTTNRFDPGHAFVDRVLARLRRDGYVVNREP